MLLFIIDIIFVIFRHYLIFLFATVDTIYATLDYFYFQLRFSSLFSLSFSSDYCLRFDADVDIRH